MWPGRSPAGWAFAMPRFTHRKVIPIGATARVVAQRAPETLTLVRHPTS